MLAFLTLKNGAIMTRLVMKIHKHKWPINKEDKVGDITTARSTSTRLIFLRRYSVVEEATCTEDNNRICIGNNNNEQDKIWKNKTR